MFERDKDDLRQTGIRVATHIPAHEMENNTETRYFIAEETFVWPKQVELSQRQLQLLQLAAQAWAQASLSSDANRALNRLRALGLPTDTSGLVGLAPRIRTHEPSFWPLNEAIELGRMVTFAYRKPGEVIARQIGNHAALVFAIGHGAGHQQLQVFGLHRVSPPRTTASHRPPTPAPHSPAGSHGPAQ
jgi:proteasome accessory factor B